MQSNFTGEVGSRNISFETGKLAQKANGSVLVSVGDNVLLVTATMSKPREGIDFFPLTIDFEEKLYARGKIPGSFFRREGRPSTHATLIARLIDRPIRPLFPKGFRNEVQIIVTALSSDQESPLDIPALIGASAALSISDVPFEGPIAATRVGYIDGEYVINPTYAQIEESSIDIIVAGSKDGVIMMEAGADEMSEDVALEAIKRAQEANKQAIDIQIEMADSIGKPKSTTYHDFNYPTELPDKIGNQLNGRLRAALDAGPEADDSEDPIESLKAEIRESLGEEFDSDHIRDAFEDILDAEFRTRILDGGVRPDGRGLREIRPISCEVSLLPRTHGTGLFARGETQVLGVATLGSVGDAQKIDTLSPEESKRFMLHYNFPPYSVGEARRVGGAGRREIGHGALAERALSPVLPSADEFPYTIRVVAECLSSNGSTSMASVCASTLALMDAGVPIKAPVAGISVGLVSGDNGNYVTLTDIQGLEDHLGDMDFKVAGTQEGITAIQLDIKVKSIGFDVVRDALAQAKEARLFILDKFKETIDEVRPDLSPHAPRMTKINIPVAKIGMVIGPGGKTIRGIIEATKATVDIQDDGSVIIGSSDGAASDKAVAMIRDLTRDVEVGDIFTGKVVKIAPFGAFVEILPGRDGLVHISELANYRVPTVEDEVEVGEEITVIVLGVDPAGKIKLSRKALLQGDSDDEDGPQREPAEAGAYSGPPSGDRRPDNRPSSPGNRPRPGGNRGGPPRPQGPPRSGGQRGGPPRSGPRPFDRQPPR